VSFLVAGPLKGRRVLVTRALHQAGKLSEALRGLGAEPVEIPLLEIRPPDSYAALDAALHALSAYNWLILTSANTVRALAERASALKLDLVRTVGLQVAAVGEATAGAARAQGFQITLTPASYVAESLLDVLDGHVQGQRVLLARAAVARDLIPDALRSAGALVDVVEAYRNEMPTEAPRALRQALAEGMDAVTFTSSSSVTHLQSAAVSAGVGWPFAGVQAVSIGPITSSTLRQSGWEPAVEAEVSDVPGLVAAVGKLLG
jgi:uroporphyrinogen-III synthase